MTSIKKRGRFYWIDYYYDGRRHRQSLKTDKFLEAKDRVKQIEEGLQKLGAGPLLSDFAETYFAWARATKPASAQEEEWRFNKIMTFLKAEGILVLSAITPLIVEKFRAKLLGDGLAKATINRYLQLLRGMFYRATDWNLFSGPNPLRKIKFYREISPIQVPSAEEIKRIQEAARKISAKPRSKLQAAFSDIVELALNTGLRKSELLHLCWKDIKDGEAYVRGKGDKVRKVPLNQSALAVIERQDRVGEFIFDIPNRNHPNLLRRTVLMAGRLAGISFHIHLFRHRFATELLERGVDVVTISEILGHSKIATSLIYSHSSRERKRAAVDMLKL